MRSSRAYVRALLIAAVLVGGGASVGFSQEGASAEVAIDANSVTQRANAILNDIANRTKNAPTEDAKKCLGEKKKQVENLKGQIAASADLQSLLAALNTIAGELDSCTGEKKGTTSSGAASGPGLGDTQVQMTIEEGTPDGTEGNPSVVIPPGPTAGGPGVIDDGFNPGDGSTPGLDPTTDPGVVVVPPPISPTT